MKPGPRSLRQALREQPVPPFDAERTWEAVRSRYARQRRSGPWATLRARYVPQHANKRLTVAGVMFALAASVLLVLTLREPAPTTFGSGVRFDSALVRRVADLEAHFTPRLQARDAAFRRQFASDLDVVQGVIVEIETYRPASASQADLLLEQHTRALEAKVRLLRTIADAN